jgi:hypothetical protein
MRLGALMRSLATSALLAALGGCVLTPVSQAGQSGAGGLLHAALRNAAVRGSVRDSVDVVVDSQRLASESDVAGDRGRQLITVSGGGQAQVLAVGNTAYVAGNQAALVNYLKFPLSYSTAIGLNWVSIPRSNKAYAAVASDVTLTSVLASLTPTGDLTEGRPTTFRGVPVIPITGGVPAITNAGGTETIDVTRSPNPLPVHVTANVEQHGRQVGAEAMTLTRWGKSIALVPPRRSIPIAELPALVNERSSLDIPDSPGYTTYTGPHGYPGPVGRPWGRACQPIVFVAQSNVPDSVYNQAVAVVHQARAQGIDVAIERRDFYWTPRVLYYRDGQNYKTAVFVHIWVDSRTPPILATGRPEHIQLGWDTRVDADGHNEDLTNVDGMLHMKVLADHPELIRRSIRQLIAMTQGVAGTGNPSSGIADRTTDDRFTPSDVAAMLYMSGCVKPRTGKAA